MSLFSTKSHFLCGHTWRRASHLMNGNRIVYSIDRTGIDKVWTTVKADYAKECKEYLDRQIIELHKLTLEQAFAVT